MSKLRGIFITKDESVVIIKNQFKKIGKGVLQDALLSFSPIFKIPPFSTISNLIIDKILDRLLTNVETGLFFLYNDFRIDAQGRAFMSAAILNQRAQLNGTEDEKKISEENLKIAFRKLVSFYS